MAIFNTLFENDLYETSDLDVAMESYGYTGDNQTYPEELIGEDICREFAEHAYKLEASEYIIDIALETAAMNGEDVDVMMENALTDLLNKAKEGILKLWDKLQSWITKVKNQFRAWAIPRTKYIAENKNGILKRIELHGAGSKNPFTYSGYEYPNSSDEYAKSVIEAAKARAKKQSEFTDSDEDTETFYQKIGDAVGIDTKSSASSLSSLAAGISEKFRGKEVIDKTPSKATVEQWIKDLSDVKGTFTKITDAESKAKKDVNDIIKNLKSAEKDAKKDDNKDAAAKIHKIVKYNNLVMSVVSKLTTVVISNYSAMFKQESKCLVQISKLSDKKEKETTTQKESFGFFDAAYDIL